MARLSRISFFLIFILLISTQICYSAHSRNKRQGVEGDYSDDKFLSSNGQKVEPLTEKLSENEVEENFAEDTANNDEEEENGIEKEEPENFIPPGEGPKKADEVALSNTYQEAAHEQYDNEQNNAEKQTESPNNNEQNNLETESPKRENDGNVVFERKSSPSAMNTAQPNKLQGNAASKVDEGNAGSAVINDETIETAKAEFSALDEKTKTELPVHKNEAGFGDANNLAANGQPANSENKNPPVQQLPTPIAQAANAAIAPAADAAGSAAITNDNGQPNAIIESSPKVGNVSAGATDTRNLPSVGNLTAVKGPVEGEVKAPVRAPDPTESKAPQQSNINGVGSAVNSGGVATNLKEQGVLEKRTDPAGQLSAPRTNTGVSPSSYAHQELRRVSPPFGDETDVNANAKHNINNASNLGAVGNGNAAYNYNNTSHPKTAGGNTDAAANPISSANANAAGSKTGSEGGSPVAKEMEANVANRQPVVDGGQNAAAGPASGPAVAPAPVHTGNHTGPLVPGAAPSPVVNPSGNEQSTAGKAENNPSPSTLDKAKEALPTGVNQLAGPLAGTGNATADLKQTDNVKDVPAESKVPPSAAAQTTVNIPSSEVRPVGPSSKPVGVAPNAAESTAQQAKAPETTHSTQFVNKQPTEPEQEENKDKIVPEVTKAVQKATTKEQIDQQTEPTEEEEEYEEEKVVPSKQPTVAAPKIGGEPYAPGTGLAGKSFSGGVRPPTYYPIQGESSHFMTYLISFTVLVVVAYLVFHNKQKIIGLMVEGRGGQRGRRGSTRYRKLDRQQNGEDTAPLFSEKGGNNVIY